MSSFKFCLFALGFLFFLMFESSHSKERELMRFGNFEENLTEVSKLRPIEFVNASFGRLLNGKNRP